MSSRMRRIIDMGPGGTVHPASAQDLRFYGNRDMLRETGTRWVRLWADWPSLQPDATRAIDDPASPGFATLVALDEQIAAANADGVKVILMPFRFPLWANGTAALGAVRNTDAEISFLPQDRMAKTNWDKYVAAGRDPSKVNPNRRALEFRVPEEGCGPGTRWAGFFAFLHARYHRRVANPARRVRAFELVNEANLQIWPQYGPSPTADPWAAAGTLAGVGSTVQMMQSAQQVSAAVGHTTLLLVPSCGDVDTGSRLQLLFVPFTTLLLDALDAAGYVPHALQGWSHHNYNDVEHRYDATGTQKVRAVLVGRWKGYTELGVPAVWITEGGARLTRMRQWWPAEDVRAAQAASITRAWQLHDTDTGAGEGVGMLAQYLTYTDRNFDAGLLEAWPSTVRRPAYAAWSALPGRA